MLIYTHTVPLVATMERDVGVDDGDDVEGVNCQQRVTGGLDVYRLTVLQVLMVQADCTTGADGTG